MKSQKITIIEYINLDIIVPLLVASDVELAVFGDVLVVVDVGSVVVVVFTDNCINSNTYFIYFQKTDF